MGRKLFIGNLPFSVDNAQLGQAFAVHGELMSAAVVVDCETQRSRGFRFVELTSDEAARAAMQALDGSPLGGRNISVREAEERKRPAMGEARSRPMEVRAPRRPSPGSNQGGGGGAGFGCGAESSASSGAGFGGDGHGGGGAGGQSPPGPGPIETAGEGHGSEGRGSGRGSKRGDDDRRRRHDDWDDE